MRLRCKDYIKLEVALYSI